jgi:hypothetical protein
MDRQEQEPKTKQGLHTLVEGSVLHLEAVAVQHIVLRLFGNRGDETVLLGDFASLGDLLRRPFGGAPIESLAFVDQVVEAANNFLHGSLKKQKNK